MCYMSCTSCIQNNIKTWYQLQNCLAIICKVMTIFLTVLIEALIMKIWIKWALKWLAAFLFHILSDRLIPSRECLVWWEHPCCPCGCLGYEIGLLQIYWSLGFILSLLVDVRGRQGSSLKGWINAAKMHIFSTCFMCVIDLVYVSMALFYVPVRLMHVMVQLVNVYGQP